MNASIRVAFLDRDGVINVDYGNVCRAEQWRFTPRAPQAIRLLHRAGFRIAVITNQAGIGRGLFREVDVRRLHSFMRRELARRGAFIDAIAYCPHAPEANCDCRKPRTGLLHSLQRQLDAPIDFAASWVVGDKISDVQFGSAIGARTALVQSEYWRADTLVASPDLISAGFSQAAAKIVALSKHLPLISPTTRDLD